MNKLTITRLRKPQFTLKKQRGSINLSSILGGVILGVLITLALVYFVNPNMQNSKKTNQAESSADSKAPLYWVAPMDDNYRRDKPGKSPMGMDLVPVYAKDVTPAETEQAGTVTISPQVVNNLGVRTAMVESRTIRQQINTVGYVQYDEDKLIHIHPRVEGWVETLYVKAAGDPVDKNQPLYTLYSPALVTAQEELIIAKKRNNQALIEAATERLKALQLGDSFIQTLLKTNKVKQSITFYSPQSGVIDNLNIREGFYVKPGTTLMSIGQLSQVWVEAEVFERDVALIEAGLHVQMQLEYLPERIWHGEIDYIYPSLTAATRTLRVRIRFDNPDLALKPNMFAEVKIDAKPLLQALTVPKEAVIRTGQQDRVVLALGDGQFKSVAVTVGLVQPDFIQITKGLSAKDKVVTSAHFLIDSESSKDSDFKRMDLQTPTAGHSQMTHAQTEGSQMKDNQMDHSQMAHNNHQMSMMPTETKQTTAKASASVNGIIEQIHHKTHSLTIARDAIKKWNRPATTMDFKVADSIDLSNLSVGDSIHFSFEVGDEFVITQIKQLRPLNSAHAAENVLENTPESNKSNKSSGPEHIEMHVMPDSTEQMEAAHD
ncbi:efflux RND transporter periplasmic adaptor subunit [Catenovulum sp. 2E275]|uniref:efflux RND transporter periplasmic adaptor subunit n=1 Tax=Catenovulum sp. 2E275 TaxID=2980497 RepID=UPI0021D007F8|nr:efflux RND transporter periplasmic adaptor subunit [Catenovulum sp. 2E275]MCU4677274.1 efflux RND transporter periplasmic adaptor subunit [Catenovulum sp. 2E275]